jgi:hypothetical protein
MFPIGRLPYLAEAVPAAPLAALQDLLSDAEIEAVCRQNLGTHYNGPKISTVVEPLHGES